MFVLSNCLFFSLYTDFLFTIEIDNLHLISGTLIQIPIRKRPYLSQMAENHKMEVSQTLKVGERKCPQNLDLLPWPFLNIGHSKSENAHISNLIRKPYLMFPNFFSSYLSELSNSVFGSINFEITTKK